MVKKALEKKDDIVKIAKEVGEVKKEVKKVKRAASAAKVAKKAVITAAVAGAAAKTVKTAAVAQKAKLQTKIFVQYLDREWDEETMIQTVKDIMEYDMQLDPSAVKKILFYVNTEEDRVYFVADDDIKGSFAL